MSEPTNAEKLIQVGKKYETERTIFIGFVDAIRQAAHKYPSLNLNFQHIHEGVFNAEEIEFTFAGAAFKLRLTFSIHDGKDGQEGSRVDFLTPYKGRMVVALSLVIGPDGVVTSIKNKSFKLPADSEHLFCSMLLSEFSPPEILGTGDRVPVFNP